MSANAQSEGKVRGAILAMMEIETALAEQSARIQAFTEELQRASEREQALAKKNDERKKHLARLNDAFLARQKEWNGKLGEASATIKKLNAELEGLKARLSQAEKDQASRSRELWAGFEQEKTELRWEIERQKSELERCKAQLKNASEAQNTRTAAEARAREEKIREETRTAVRAELEGLVWFERQSMENRMRGLEVEHEAEVRELRAEIERNRVATEKAQGDARASVQDDWEKRLLKEKLEADERFSQYEQACSARERELLAALERSEQRLKAVEEEKRAIQAACERRITEIQRQREILDSTRTPKDDELMRLRHLNESLVKLLKEGREIQGRREESLQDRTESLIRVAADLGARPK